MDGGEGDKEKARHDRTCVCLRVYSLVADKATKGHASPAHAIHEAAGEGFPPVSIHIFAILVVHRYRSRASAYKRVLAGATH